LFSAYATASALSIQHSALRFGLKNPAIRAELQKGFSSGSFVLNMIPEDEFDTIMAGNKFFWLQKKDDVLLAECLFLISLFCSIVLTMRQVLWNSILF
jgi:hypothetical protein